MHDLEWLLAYQPTVDKSQYTDLNNFLRLGKKYPSIEVLEKLIQLYEIGDPYIRERIIQIFIEWIAMDSPKVGTLLSNNATLFTQNHIASDIHWLVFHGFQLGNGSTIFVDWASQDIPLFQGIVAGLPLTDDSHTPDRASLANALRLPFLSAGFKIGILRSYRIGLNKVVDYVHERRKQKAIGVHYEATNYTPSDIYDSLNFVTLTWEEPYSVFLPEFFKHLIEVAQKTSDQFGNFSVNLQS